MPRKVQASDLQPANGEKSRGIKKKKKVVDDTTLFASYLPKLCNAVFQSDSGVTMSGKTCRSLSALLGSLEDVLTSDAKRIAEFQQKKSILPVSVQVALATRLPRALTSWRRARAATPCTRSRRTPSRPVARRRRMG